MEPKRQDDTRDEAVDVAGLIKMARRAAARLVGWDDLQKDTLKACLDDLESAEIEMRGFVRQRERMQQ